VHILVMEMMDDKADVNTLSSCHMRSRGTGRLSAGMASIPSRTVSAERLHTDVRTVSEHVMHVITFKYPTTTKRVSL
jgi:hypothetical protein